MDAETGANLSRDHNNMLSEVTIDSTIHIINSRDANGVLRRRVIDSAGVMTIIDKIGDTEFRNGAISTVHHPNGYITFDWSVPEELRLTGTEMHTVTEEAISITSDRILQSGTDEENIGQESVNLIKGFEVSSGAEYLADIDTFTIDGLNYFYVIKDHLSSPRVTFTDANNDNSPEVTDIKNYYAFGLEYDDTTTEVVPNYRQSYNDKEAVSYTNYLEFEARGYIKSINLFDGPDPISQKFPHLSTTNYASLSPVANIDLWGLQAVSINSRSFAPFDKFGKVGPFGPFKGDGANRGFSTSSSATSRIRTEIPLNLSASGTKLNDRPEAFGSVSTSLKTGKSIQSDAYSYAKMAQGNDGISTLSFSLFGNNDLIPPSPDIDVNGIIQIGMIDLGDGSTEASINGSISGDGFPNSETFLSDQSGQSVFLSTFETNFGPNYGPAAGLLGNTNRDMGKIQPMKIRFGQDGNILNISSGGKTYSVEAWNAQFTQNIQP